MVDIKKKEEEKPKVKKTFVVEIEGTVPMAIKYRVMAEDEDDAIKRFKQGYAQLESVPKIDHRKIIKKKVLVRDPTSVFSKPYPPF